MPASTKIAPSLLSGDFANLASECNKMLDFGGDYLHMDVMDGHFVPNLTLGPPIIKSLRPHTKGYLDCHLMVSNPEKWIDQFAKAGANGVTFHIEVCDTENDAKSLCQKIQALGMKAGIAIKPKTPVDSILSILESGNSLVDMILVMTVEPGFGGQKFMADCMPKVKVLRDKFPDLDIQVDGGLDLETVEIAAENGANVIVAGTSIFKSESPRNTISQLREKVEKFGKK